MGEHAMPGETARETSVRGLREELGVEVALEDVAVACVYEFRHIFHLAQGLRTDRQLTYATVVNLRQHAAPTVLANTKEVAEYAWVLPRRLLEMTAAPLDGTSLVGMCDPSVSKLFRDTFLGACAALSAREPGVSCDLQIDEQHGGDCLALETAIEDTEDR